jgi:acyl-CoA synthetase (AMP-forming)/AMP-acid ligase II
MRQSGQSERTVAPSTLVSLLRMRARQQPHRIGYAFVPEEGGELQISCAELDRQARAIAGLLAGLRGKTALLLYPPGLDSIAAIFGCLYAGVIAVPAPPPDQVRPDRSLPRLAAIVRDAAPSAVLTTAAMSGAARFLPAPPELSRLRVITTDEAATGDAAAQDTEPAPVSADSVALLQYNSGSTAEPVGVVITHGNLMSNSELIFALFGHSNQSRGVSWLSSQQRLSADAPPSSQAPYEVHALESSPAGAPEVRHYCWVRGSRVPARSVLTADLFPGEHGWWLAARGRWESLPCALTAIAAAHSHAGQPEGIESCMAATTKKYLAKHIG